MIKKRVKFSNEGKKILLVRSSKDGKIPDKVIEEIVESPKSNNQENEDYIYKVKEEYIDNENPKMESKTILSEQNPTSTASTQTESYVFPRTLGGYYRSVFPNGEKEVTEGALNILGYKSPKQVQTLNKYYQEDKPSSIVEVETKEVAKEPYYHPYGGVYGDTKKCLVQTNQIGCSSISVCGKCVFKLEWCSNIAQCIDSKHSCLHSLNSFTKVSVVPTIVRYT